MSRPAAPRGGTVLGIDRGTFYRQVRAFHGYLSALSFILLMAFAATGILLNHPGWLASRPPSEDRTLTLGKDEMRDALQAQPTPNGLAALVAGRTSLRGAFKSGEVIDEEARLRFEGVTGTTDVVVDLQTGAAEIAIERASTLQILNDLHRGKNAGSAWSWVIDLSAALILAMSVLGYIIFFSLRFRLRTSLALTAISLLILIGVFASLVP